MPGKGHTVPYVFPCERRCEAMHVGLIKWIFPFMLVTRTTGFFGPLLLADDNVSLVYDSILR